MSRIVISVIRGKDVKTLSYDNVRSVTIVNGGRRYVITPTRINVDNASDGGNVIRVDTRSGSHNVLDYKYNIILPIDLDNKYIVVWYDEDGGIIAHANVDGRFVDVSIRAWP